MKRSHLVVLPAAVLSLFALTAPARAAAWGFTLTPYMWATGVGVDADLAGRQVVDKDISVNDLVKDLDTIFQMKLEVTYGRFGLYADGFDVNLSNDKNGVTLPQGAGSADLSSTAGMTIVDVAGTFDPIGERSGLALVAGSRILNDRATVDATIRPSPGGTALQSYDAHETLGDALIGVHFRHAVWGRFGMQMQADASTGGTDYTWSVAPALTCTLDKLGRVGIDAGYRYMKIDFKDDGSLDTQMRLSGAIVGLRTSF